MDKGSSDKYCCIDTRAIVVFICDDPYQFTNRLLTAHVHKSHNIKAVVFL